MERNETQSTLNKKRAANELFSEVKRVAFARMSIWFIVMLALFAAALCVLVHATRGHAAAEPIELIAAAAIAAPAFALMLLSVFSPSFSGWLHADDIKESNLKTMSKRANEEFDALELEYSDDAAGLHSNGT